MARHLSRLLCAGMLVLAACGGTTTDTDSDTDSDTPATTQEGCCVLKDSLRAELEASSTDPATFEAACAQFDDSTTFPATVGAELCEDLSDGAWCEWTCE